MIAFYDEKPSKLEAVGNGSYKYRYNIEEVETQTSQGQDGESETRTQWQCEEAVVWSPVTSNRITEAAITDRWAANYEQKLVNEYNAAKLGLYGSTSSADAKARIQRYTDYLTERASLKTQIDADCEEATFSQAADTAFNHGASLADIKGIAEATGAEDSEVLAKMKSYASRLIEQYDTSEFVNSFTLQGKKMWLAKDTRVGLVNSITIEKNAGKEETTLWFGGEQYTLPVDTALQMLSALELYALECYNQTQKHLAAVEALETVDEVVAYDYTAGYPEQLTLNS